MRNSPLLPSWTMAKLSGDYVFRLLQSMPESERDKFASLMSAAGNTSYGATSTSSSTPAPASTDATVQPATPVEEPPMPPPPGPPEFADTVPTEDYGASTGPTAAASTNKAPTSTPPSTAPAPGAKTGTVPQK